MWGAIAAAGAQMASGLVGNILNYNATQRANAANIGIAREQMAFQERMSNTAVQRHANDLEKAGFNRLLAAGGEGASTPAGASTHVSAPQVTPVDILAIQQARANIAKTNAETAVAQATERNLDEQNANLRINNRILDSQDVVRGTEAIKASQDRNIVDSWFGRNVISPLRVIFGSTGTTVGPVSGYTTKTHKTKY